jgi:hypothetical protein
LTVVVRVVVEVFGNIFSRPAGSDPQKLLDDKNDKDS